MPKTGKDAELVQALIPQLSVHEGRRYRRYFDSVGVPTIGIGFNLQRKDAKNVFKKLGIKDFYLIYAGEKELTDEEIDRLFSYTIRESINEAKDTDVGWEQLSLYRRAVVVDMVFNLGKRGFLGFVHTREMIRNGEYTEASRNMLYSKWATQVGRRAYRLSYMMRNDASFDEALNEVG